MNDTTVPDRPDGARGAVQDRQGVGAFCRFEPLGRQIMARTKVKHRPIDEEERTVEPVAQSYRASQDGVENRLDFGLRTGDHSKDLARRRLLFQRLRQIGVACLQLLEQPNVLNRYDGLVGEGLHQFDLLHGKR